MTVQVGAVRERRSRMVRRILGLVFVVISASAGVAGSAPPLCIPVHARIEALFVTEGCDSPVGLCTEGRVTEGGLLNGSTSFTALAAAPAAGLYDIEADTTLSYNGQLTILTRHGALILSDVGVFDQEANAFTELDRVSAGTGKFKNASGTLYISGRSFPDGSGFDGRITGELCLTN